LNRRCALLFVLLVPWSGCSGDDPSQEAPRVPVGGTIRLDGKPLSGAVVVFLPTDERGKPAQSDTDENGAYSLSVLGFPGGTTPGKYRVGVSYLLSPKGRAIGLSGRGSLPPNPEAARAKELVPPRYSDLGRSELYAVVTPPGGTFDFDLQGPLLPPPPPEPDAAPPSATQESPPPNPSPSH